MNQAHRVLIVEDSDTQALKLAGLLENEGLSVHRTATAELALEYLHTHLPDLVIVDYHLPGMSGSEFCRVIRQHKGTESVPLLILTDDLEADVERHGLESGADDHVTKTSDTDVLLARVEALLRKPRSQSLLSSWSSAYFESQRILIVDDSPTYLTFLELELQQEGYQVITADGGESALQIVSKQDIDCVVLDLVMPRIDGIELCKRLNQMRCSTHLSFPILMVTSHESKEEMMRALEAGADDFVRKSNDTVILRARIRALLRRKMLHDEHDRILTEFRNKELEVFRARAEQKAALARAEIAEQLEKANRELEKANVDLKDTQVQLVQSAKMASLGELVAGVAHEVNNPLAYSMGHVRTIAGTLDAISPELEGKLSDKSLSRLSKVRQRTKGAIEGLERVRDLMTKLRTFSRLDEGTFKTADMRECIEATLPLIQHRLGKGIEVKALYAEDNELYCAPGMLNQVVMNLLTNAIDAVGEKGEIIVSTRRDNGDFCVAVADSGPGIPDHVRPRLFEPFFTTKEIGGGTGLGLAISYRIVERHKGQIEARNRHQGGAEFIVRIPTNLAECTNVS